MSSLFISRCLWGRITVWSDLLFDWFGFSSSSKHKKQHLFLVGQIQSSQTGYQPYSDPSPYPENFLRASITVRLTSCFTGYDSAALLMLN